jgi:cytochrome P450
MRSRGKDYELSDDELAANTDILMVAGSETTATLLAGVIYLLLANPNKLRKVKQEVRSAFETIDEISFAAASMKLPYTLACLTEALRLYPPVPVPLLRETLPDQMTPIAGHLIPANVSLIS